MHISDVRIENISKLIIALLRAGTEQNIGVDLLDSRVDAVDEICPISSFEILIIFPNFLSQVVLKALDSVVSLCLHKEMLIIAELCLLIYENLVVKHILLVDKSVHT